ncbi:MAG: GNAT family N-acetyltransferase [Aeropyrum sp.]|nr:GNAT family N-acetyltransferase [Aeropyrum sp.]MCE4615650.1 GNAT family N-acetyltransferase [Aeropyrum sp.]
MCGRIYEIVESGGLRFRIRGLCPEDKEQLIRFYESLSEETIYTRFFTIVRYFDPYVEKMISTICSLVIVAVEEGSGRIVGVAEAYIDDRGIAEAGIVILEKYQGRGLGSKLARHLISVLKEFGAKKLYGYVLSDNSRALSLAKKLGAKIVREAPGIIRVEIAMD